MHEMENLDGYLQLAHIAPGSPFALALLVGMLESDACKLIRDGLLHSVTGKLAWHSAEVCCAAGMMYALEAAN